MEYIKLTGVILSLLCLATMGLAEDGELRAWFMNDSNSYRTLPNQLDPRQPVSMEDLEKIGVLYFNIDVDEDGNYKEEGATLDTIRKERGYNYEDTITVSRESLTDFDEKTKLFYTEHLHADEEIRLVLNGSGYFEVRNYDERWIRIEGTKGDLIVMPAGIYHRFTLDTDEYISANRLFRGDPVWKAYYRPAEDVPVRKEYLAYLSETIGTSSGLKSSINLALLLIINTLHIIIRFDC